MNSLIFKIFIILIMLTVISTSFIPSNIHAAGNNYYVSKTGNDSNDGSLSYPFLTIQKAAITASAGDTVYIMAGTYNEHVHPTNSGSSGNYIMYRNYGSDKVIIDGTGIVETWLFRLDGDGLTGGMSYIWVQGITIQNATSSGLGIIHGNHYVTIKDVVIKNTYHTSLGVIYDTNTEAFNDGRETNITLNNVEVNNGCLSGTAENIRFINVSSFEVKNCTIHDCTAHEGIALIKGCHDGSVHNNEFYDMASYNITIESRGSNSYNIDIYSNKFHDGGSTAVLLNSETTVCTISDIDIYNNIFYNNAEYGILIYDETSFYLNDVVISNNTFYSTLDNADAIMNNHIASEETNCVIANNIFWSVNNTQYMIYFAYHPKGSGMTITNNLFYATGSYATGNEYGLNYIYDDDPLFISPTTNFNISLSSPAKDNGNATYAPSTDYAGNSRPYGAKYDIGAYEAIDSSTSYTNTMQLRITDTSGVDRTNVVALVPVTGSSLVSSNYINSDGTDTNMELSGVNTTYSMNTTRIPMVLDSLGMNQTQLYDLRMGYSPVKSNFPIIVGEDGYMTTFDSSDIELSDNFGVTVNGYINTSTGADKNIVNKEDAISISVDSIESSQINATIGNDNGSKILVPLDNGATYSWGMNLYKLSNTQAIIVESANYYGSLKKYFRTVNYSNNYKTVTFGTPVTVSNDIVDQYFKVARINDTKFAVVYDFVDGSDDVITVAIGTVSGTSITFGSDNDITSFTTNPSLNENSIGIALIDTDKLAITYPYSGYTPQYYKLIIGTVSGSTVSFGTGVEWVATTEMNTSLVAKLDTNKGIIAYESFANWVKAIAFTVSGTVPTFGSEVTLDEKGTDIGVNLEAIAQITTDKFVVEYYHKSTGNIKIYCTVGTTSGTVITLGTEKEIDSGASGITVGSLCAVDATHFCVAHFSLEYPNDEKNHLGYCSISGTTITVDSLVNIYPYFDTIGQEGAEYIGNDALIYINGYLSFTSDSYDIDWNEYASLQTFEYGEPGFAPTVSATGIYNGVHEVKVILANDILSIYIDNLLKDSVNCSVSVPNNSSDYIWNQNNVMTYINSILFSTELVAGVQDSNEMFTISSPYNTLYTCSRLARMSNGTYWMAYTYSKTTSPFDDYLDVRSSSDGITWSSATNLITTLDGLGSVPVILADSDDNLYCFVGTLDDELLAYKKPYGSSWSLVDTLSTADWAYTLVGCLDSSDTIYLGYECHDIYVVEFSSDSFGVPVKWVTESSGSMAVQDIKIQPSSGDVVLLYNYNPSSEYDLQIKVNNGSPIKVSDDDYSYPVWANQPYTASLIIEPNGELDIAWIAYDDVFDFSNIAFRHANSSYTLDTLEFLTDITSNGAYSYCGMSMMMDENGILHIIASLKGAVNSSYDLIEIHGTSGSWSEATLLYTDTDDIEQIATFDDNYPSTIRRYSDGYLATVLLSDNETMMSYYGNFTPTGGNDILLYEPTIMQTDTTVDDEIGSNPATITWGTNHNLSFGFGSLMPYTMAIPGETGGITLPTFAETLVNPQEELHSLPFWDIFSRASSDVDGTHPNGGGINPNQNSGITMYGLYLLMGIAVVLAIGAWIALLTGSKIVLLISLVIMMAIFVQPLFSAWMVIALIIGGVSILYISRGGGM